jgi:hypothetical protein
MRADELMPDAHAHLKALEAHCMLLFLTSRKEDRREVTEEALRAYSLLVPGRDVYMKPIEWQYLSTLNYKVGMVHFLKRAFQAEHIIFIDDEQGIREAVSQLALPSCTIQVYPDLASACAEL